MILLSQFIEYFDIDVENEVTEEFKPLNQMSALNLTKIGLKKIKNKKWVCKDEDSDAADNEEEEEEQSTEGEDGDKDKDTDMPFAQEPAEPESPTVQHQDSFNRLEQFMINQFNQLGEQNRMHHEYCQTHFQHIETQVEDIQSKLGTLFFPPDE